MKQYETEKHNIPEGATHYRNEDRHSLFTWLKVGDDIELWCDILETWMSIGSHVDCIMDKITPIPQTNVETPEEKEVLDLINTTPHQYEMSKFSGEAEWNGEGLPPVGVECEAVFIEHEHKGYGEFLILGYHGNYVWLEYIGDLPNKSKHYTAKIDLVKFRKSETPQQREERERLEAAYDLYLIRCHAVNHPVVYEFHEFKSAPEAIDGWLAVVDKTSYRKESNQ